MIDRNTVVDGLREVLDPEIGISIVDLNMVRDIKIDDSNVEVTIALTVAHCPLAKTLQADVEKALKKIGEVRSVTVNTTAMSKSELNELRTKLQARAATPQTETKASIGAGIERLGKKHIRSIIAIMSGKGGVGKSFVTSALAVQLRNQGYEVGILDADLTGPSIAKVFGLDKRPSKTPNGGIAPVITKSGIKVMSINLVLEDPGMPVIWRGPIVNSVIRQLYWDVEWGALHYLLVDLPPGTSDAPLTVFQSIPLDGVIVVSSPQDLASMIVTKAVNMGKKMNAELLGIVENMSHLECPHCGQRTYVFGTPQGAKLARELGLPLLGSIPIDPAISSQSDKGLIENYTSPAIAGIADQLRLKTSQQIVQGGQELPIAWTTEATA